jgi:putative transposase
MLSRARPLQVSTEVDLFGNLVNVRLSQNRDLAAAEVFFKQSLQTAGHTPEKVTTDKHPASPKAIRKTLERRVKHRTSQYVKNRLEQEHRHAHSPAHRAPEVAHRSSL